MTEADTTTHTHASRPNWVFVIGARPESAPPAVHPCAILKGYEEWHVGYPSIVRKPGTRTVGFLMELQSEFQLEVIDHRVDSATGMEFHRIPVTVETLHGGYKILAWVYQHVGHASPADLKKGVPPLYVEDDVEAAWRALK